MTTVLPELVEAGRDELDPLVPVLSDADESDERIRAELYTVSRTTYRAMVGTELVGAATMHWHGDDSELVYLAVVPGSRRRGYGRSIVAALLDEARRRGVPAVSVGTADSSPDTIGFYQRCGFRMDHVRRDYFAYVQPPVVDNGIPMRDMLVLRYTLNGNPDRHRHPLFCDTALARRIETAEAQLMEHATRAAHRRTGKAGFVLPIAGGVATFADDGSPFNKVAGLGFAGAPDERELDEIERAFAARGTPVQIELAHLADAGIGTLLTARGYRLVSFENVLGRTLHELPVPVTPPGVEVRRAGPDEFDTWLDVVADGFAHPDTQGVPSHEDFPRTAIDNAERDFTAAAVIPYLAWCDGQVAGGGSIRFTDGIAQLTGAATAPVHRRRGVQTALLAARLADAAAAGCDLAVVTTQPGSRSQHNVQRRGFDLLYTRAVLTRTRTP